MSCIKCRWDTRTELLRPETFEIMLVRTSILVFEILTLVRQVFSVSNPIITCQELHSVQRLGQHIIIRLFISSTLIRCQKSQQRTHAGLVNAWIIQSNLIQFLRSYTRIQFPYKHRSNHLPKPKIGHTKLLQ